MLSKTHPSIIKCVSAFVFIFCFINPAYSDNSKKPNYFLSGHITDAQTGRPVIDAVVSLNRFYSAPTDIDGFYYFDKFPDGNNFKIAVDSNEYVGIYDYNSMPAVKLAKDKSIIKDFKLDKACMVELRIVDEANKPVKDAKISAVLNDEQKNKQIGSDYFIRCTDPNGFLTFGGFPPSKNNYLITAIKSGKSKFVSDTGKTRIQPQYEYAPGILKIDLNDVNTIESAQIILKKGVDVNGIILYQDDIPASDITIAAYPELCANNISPEIFSVDSNGNFNLKHIVPGIYQLKAFMPHGSRTGLSVAKLQLPPANNKSLSLKIPQKSPKTLASIEGKFIFTSGEVPDYVNINAYSQRYGSYNATWQNNIDVCDYNFIIDRLEPDAYTLYFSAPGFEQKIIQNIDAPAKNLDIEIKSYGSLTLNGIVLNAQSRLPVQKFRARARRYQSYTDYSSQQPDTLQEFENPDGRFSINAVSPGIYQVQIIADGFTWTWSEYIDTKQNNIVITQLSNGGTLRGKVKDTSGKLITGAKVFAFSKVLGYDKLPYHPSLISSFFSDEGAVATSDGIFEMNNLTAGLETIKVTHPDYAYGTMSDIEIKEGQTTDIEVIMKPGGIVEGYVYDSKYQPSANMTLYFQQSRSSGKSGRFTEVKTDSKGYYRAGGLPEETIIVTRPENYEGSGVINRLIVPLLGKTFHLDIGGKPTLSGKIVLNGKPLANQKIVLSGINSPLSTVFQCIAITGDNGEFSFNGIPRGIWAIYYQNANDRTRWIKLSKINTTGQDQDLGAISESHASIYLSLQFPSGVNNMNYLQASLQKKGNVYDHIADFVKTSNSSEEYAAHNIAPGEYSITLYQQNFTMLFPVVTYGSDIKINLQIPVCTSGVYGNIKGNQRYAYIWRQDKMFQAGIQTDENGNYKIDNLPVGRYSICYDWMREDSVILNFELAQGEQKEINFEIPDVANKERGYLSVLPLDENGTVLTDAAVTLEDDSGIIEPYPNTTPPYFNAATGTYELHITCKGYKEINQSANLEKRNDHWNRLIIRMEKQ